MHWWVAVAALLLTLVLPRAHCQPAAHLPACPRALVTPPPHCTFLFLPFCLPCPPLSPPGRVPVLSDWHLLLSWARQGTAEEHFGEAGITNLLHLLRDSLHRATGGSLAGGGGEQRPPGGHKGRERKEVQVGG